MFNHHHKTRRAADAGRPVVIPVGGAAKPHWGLGLFAATVLLALFSLGAWLDDDSYLAELSLAEQAAWSEGAMAGRLEMLAEAQAALQRVYEAGLAQGLVHGLEMGGCGAPQGQPQNLRTGTTKGQP